MMLRARHSMILRLPVRPKKVKANAMNPGTVAQAKALRKKVRDFEDRKISAADLGRAIFFVAREVDSSTELRLRQSLEKLGNQVRSLAEQSLTSSVHADVLALADDVSAELAEFGY
jgi:hypothetical protein